MSLRGIGETLKTLIMGALITPHF